MSASTFMVSWRRYGVPYHIDIDNQNRALAMCVALAELRDAKRTDVAITEVEYEVDEELKARIQATIQRRIDNAWAETPMVMA